MYVEAASWDQFHVSGSAGISAAEAGRSPQSSGEKRKAETALKNPQDSSMYATSEGDGVKRRLSPDPEVRLTDLGLPLVKFKGCWYRFLKIDR